MRNKRHAHERSVNFRLGQQLQILAPNLDRLLVAAGIFIRQNLLRAVIANVSGRAIVQAGVAAFAAGCTGTARCIVR